MRRFLRLLAIALVATVPALVFRVVGFRPNPVIDMAVFGIAILAAGFMLSWGAEAAEKRISQGLVLALVALITVLPEYAVDLYYAYEAGKAPQSNYVHYAAANMTGANRLLVGIAWPLLLAVSWARTRKRHIALATVSIIDVGFLLLASLYAFVIVVKQRIGLVDFAVLLAIYGAYLWQTGRVPKTKGGENADDDEPGPAAVLATLSTASQWLWVGGLSVAAAVVIFVSAEPFAEAMVSSGRVLGIDEYLLIQWLAPLASEAPAVAIALLFVTSGRAERGLGTMVSDKINQWTLLVGMLPLAMSAGAGQLMALPLDARQQEEFFLTASQSLLGVALLLKLRFGLLAAIALALLFAVQIGVAYVFRNDSARSVASLTVLAWLYLVLGIGVSALRAPSAWRTLKELMVAMREQRLREAAVPEPPNS